mmetsp:Transcript_17383/g.27185  ORF Transcript_17383/g.27185 Transcript_17383/m.27185 type:complete len:222 (-) Transcript_17383:88-753(-)
MRMHKALQNVQSAAVLEPPPATQPPPAAPTQAPPVQQLQPNHAEVVKYEFLVMRQLTIDAARSGVIKTSDVQQRLGSLLQRVSSTVKTQRGKPNKVLLDCSKYLRDLGCVTRKPLVRQNYRQGQRGGNTSQHYSLTWKDGWLNTVTNRKRRLQKILRRYRTLDFEAALRTVAAIKNVSDAMEKLLIEIRKEPITDDVDRAAIIGLETDNEDADERIDRVFT